MNPRSKIVPVHGAWSATPVITIPLEPVPTRIASSSGSAYISKLTGISDKGLQVDSRVRQVRALTQPSQGRRVDAVPACLKQGDNRRHQPQDHAGPAIAPRLLLVAGARHATTSPLNTMLRIVAVKRAVHR